MNARRWSCAVTILALLGLSIIAFFNYIVDPGGIYLRKTPVVDEGENVAEKLFTSKNGLVTPADLNERAFKIELVKQSDGVDCIVIGSSHAMQISGVRKTGGINAKCTRLLNLSVSGGTLEDISIFTYLILHGDHIPKTVLLVLDPWALKFGSDKRFKENSYLYNKMNALLNTASKVGFSSFFYDRASNLLNIEYLSASIRTLMQGMDRRALYPPSSDFNYKEGYLDPVTLPDGSLVYSKDFIKASREDASRKGTYDYKISGEMYDPRAVSYLKKIINLYKDKNIGIDLVLTPYAPKVFSEGETKVVKYLKVVESVVRKFAINNKLKVYGSYFSKLLGCKESEFFDFMHPTNRCLNRINFSK